MWNTWSGEVREMKKIRKSVVCGESLCVDTNALLKFMRYTADVLKNFCYTIHTVGYDVYITKMSEMMHLYL